MELLADSIQSCPTHVTGHRDSAHQFWQHYFSAFTAILYDAESVLYIISRLSPIGQKITSFVTVSVYFQPPVTKNDFYQTSIYFC